LHEFLQFKFDIFSILKLKGIFIIDTKMPIFHATPALWAYFLVILFSSFFNVHGCLEPNKKAVERGESDQGLKDDPAEVAIIVACQRVNAAANDPQEEKQEQDRVRERNQLERERRIERGELERERQRAREREERERYLERERERERQRERERERERYRERQREREREEEREREREKWCVVLFSFTYIYILDLNHLTPYFGFWRL
jgi:hypothetical protein